MKYETINAKNPLEVAFLNDLKGISKENLDGLTVLSLIEDIWDSFEDGGYDKDYPIDFAKLSPEEKEVKLLAIAKTWNLKLTNII